MDLCRRIDEIRRSVGRARRAGRTIGVVPTMGALHAGHAALIDAAVGEGHFVVVTIFVNPAQFGPSEDLGSYPRPFEADMAVCREHGVSAVFAPSVEEMYPPQAGAAAGRAATTVSVTALTAGLCGRRRPGHFDGVCTVVTKLLNIVTPEVAYFGQKDAQQAAVIRRLVDDLSIPVRVAVCPTVREPDGLAISSRNRYLTGDQREQSTQLYVALRLAEREVAGGNTDPAAVARAMRSHLTREAPLGEVEYLEIVDQDSLQPVSSIDRPVLVALAVRFGAARLIDNLRVDATGVGR